MSDNRRPVEHQDKQANLIQEQGAAYGARTGIGGGFVGAAIGVLLGRRVGGVFGGVVGAVAGALVGKGTAQRVNRTVASVVEAAKTAEKVAETVNYRANSLGNAIQDTVEDTKSSVIGVVDAIKETVEETKSSVVGAAKSVAEGVNYTVNDVKTVGNVVKDAVEEVKPSVIAIVDAIKDTVEEVKPSVVDAARSVAEEAKHRVDDLGNVLKKSVEEVEPSVMARQEATQDTPEVNPSLISIEEAVTDTTDESVIDVDNPTKDTAEEAQPSLVSAAKTLTETVNPSENGIGNTRKDTVEEVKPSVIAVENAAKAKVEEVKLSDNHNSKLYQQQLVGVELRRLSQDNFVSHDVKEQAPQKLQNSQASQTIKEIDILAIEYKNIQPRQEEFKRNKQEIAQEFKQPKNQLQPEKVQKITGILLGAVTISLIGAVWGFTSRQNLLATKSPESNLVIKSAKLGTNSLTYNENLKLAPKTTSKTIADGWIFLGNVKNTSSSRLVEKSLIKGSASINSAVIPSVGSIVTVRVSPGVTLRKNRPQAPNFNPQEQKALAVIKHREKLKILKVELITPSNKTRPATPATKIWAQVDRCGRSCH